MNYWLLTYILIHFLFWGSELADEESDNLDKVIVLGVAVITFFLWHMSGILTLL